MTASANACNEKTAVDAATLQMQAAAELLDTTKTDITNAEASIRTQYENKPGITVTEVTLMKENSHRLTGFAKLKLAGLNIEITKSCHATWEDGGYRYMIGCDGGF